MPDLPTRDRTAGGGPTADQADPDPTDPHVSSDPTGVGGTHPHAGGDTGEPPAATVPPTAVPGCDLLAEIGRGGMGVVYRAVDRGLGRPVAVKLLHDRYPTDGAAARRFLREAAITAGLQHPGIPPVHQAGTTAAGRPYLVMKLIEGRTLDRLIAAGGGRSSDLIATFEGVCQAVGYAHAHGVVHRDLKPANVMVGAFGEVQVMDWGLAKVLASPGRPSGEWPPDADPDAPDLPAPPPAGGTPPVRETHTGSVLGTLAYMAPEQATGATDRLDERTDVFGLGGVLCAVLTGRPPYVGDSAESTHRQAVGGELADAFGRLDRCGADPGLIALCKRCLSADKGGRPADGEAVAAAVGRLRADADDRARRAEVERAAAAAEAREQAKRRRVQRRLWVTVAAALAVGTGVSVWLAVRATAAEDRTARQLERTKEAEAVAVHRADAATAAKEFLKSVLVQGDPKSATKERAADRNRTLRAALDYAAREIEGRFDDQPGIEADLRTAIGIAYLGLEAPAAAGPHLRRAAELVEAGLGPDHPDALAAAHNLAVMYRDLGDHRAARPLLERVLGGFEAAFGPDHPNTLTAVNNLGMSRQALGDFAAAERLFRRALAGREAALGPAHADTLTSSNNLGVLLSETGGPEALPLLKRALAGREAADGPTHPFTLTTVNNLAELYVDLGNDAEALKLHRRALAGREEVLGPDHPETFVSLNNLGALARRTGDPVTAERLLSRALAGREKAIGRDHLDTLTTANNLARALVDLGRPAEAEPLFRRVLGGLEAAVGAGHPNALRAAGSLGLLLADAGRPGEAVPLLERAYAARRKYPPFADYRDRLAEAYAAAGRPADAIRHVLGWLGDDRRRLTAVPAEQAAALATAGRQLLDLDPKAAEPVLRECLELREKLAPTDWRTANVRSMLGGAVLAQSRPAEAEPLLKAGYEGMMAVGVPAGGRVYLADAAGRLERVYRLLDKPGEAARWRAERAKYPPDVAPRPRPARR